MQKSSNSVVPKFERIRSATSQVELAPHNAEIITEDGTNFKVHRAILAQQSIFFSKLFAHNGDRTQFHLDGISSATLRPIINWMYTQKLDPTLDFEAALLTIQASDYLQAKGCLDASTRLAKNLMTPDTALWGWVFARHFNLVDLGRWSWTYITFNFKEVSLSDDFTGLEYKEMKVLLGSDDLNAREAQIWTAAYRWIQAEPETRQLHAHELFEFMRHPELWEDIRLQLSAQRRLMRKQIITGDWKAASEVLPGIPPTAELNHKISRNWANSILISGGWRRDFMHNGPCNVIDVFDFRRKSWRTLGLADPYGSRCYMSAEVIPQKCIFFVGGSRDGRNRSEVNRLDLPNLNQFSKVCSMNEARCFVSTATLEDGKILAIGGHNGRQRLKSAEKYDPEEDRWDFVAPMNEVRSDAGACTWKGQVYIAGGFNGLQVLASAEKYDPILDQWTYIPSMSTRRSGHQVVAAHGLLFCLGGFDGRSRLATGERFSFQKNRWKKMSDMPNARSNFAAATFDNKILVVGGFQDTSPIRSVELYDISTNSWTSVRSPLAGPRSALTLAFLPGGISVPDSPPMAEDDED